jgi:hypothetical protein
VKLGTENKKQVMALAVFGTVAIVLLLWTLWPSSTPAPAASATGATTTPAAGASRAATVRRTASGKTIKTAVEPRLDPTLELDVLRQSEEIKYEGQGRNIFVARSEEIVKPIKSGRAPGDNTADLIKAPPIPPPPPITLKFFGFANRPGEPKSIFLSQDGDIFVAKEGDIVDRRYRVLRISPTSVEIEDVLNNNKQSIPLTQG